MKLFYILPVIGVLFIFAQSNEVFGQDVKTENHDGLGGWACWTNSSHNCNGINTYPISVSQGSYEGRQSIHVSGDPSGNTVACAKKTISTDWFIEKIELGVDVNSVKTKHNFPVIYINNQSFNPSVPNYEWSSFSRTLDIPNQTGVEIKLCVIDTVSGNTHNLNAYFSNIQIKTYQINPEYIEEQKELDKQREDEIRQKKLEADEAEKERKAAEEKQEQDERKADADEARADAVNRSSDAIERSKNAAERAMHDAYRANADAIKILEYAQYEAAFQERAAQALEFSLQAMKKAEEAEKRAEAAREAIEDFEREAARDGAEDAADAAKRYADQVHLIALSIPKAFGAETSNSDTPKIIPPEGGGCLIATAAYGSEMAPQVQFLRELRDNTVLQTQSGKAFMTGFNQFYYSFSPAVADLERENPIFKETVKVALTPMLTSLTLLNYVDVDTEEEMLGYGIGIILLNVGMYFVAPAIIIIKLKNFRIT